MEDDEEAVPSAPDWANATIDETDGKTICPGCQKKYANRISYREHVKMVHKFTLTRKNPVGLLLWFVKDDMHMPLGT